MLKNTIRPFFKRLARYRLFAPIVTFVEKTSEPALHWYFILGIGISITVLNVAIAWFVFYTVSTQGSDIFGRMTNATTINRTDLQKALEMYKSRDATFADLKENPVDIIDPGR